jgi:TrmH family RNA methyltransferase
MALEALMNSTNNRRRVDITESSDAELSKAASTDTPQGVVCIAEQPERSFETIPPAGNILLLDGVQDPGNVGTILRTAQAFGVAATVALPGTVDLWNPKVVRSAMGALFSHHAFHADVGSSLEYLAAASIPLWATSMSGEPVSRIGAGKRTAIVVGNEAGGVSAELAEAAARNVAIPINGVESLNVAVATGIILYAITAS